MFTESFNQASSLEPPAEKMLLGQLEGKLAATKILLKQGMAWTTIAELMDMTEEQIAFVETYYH